MLGAMNRRVGIKWGGCRCGRQRAGPCCCCPPSSEAVVDHQRLAAAVGVGGRGRHDGNQLLRVQHLRWARKRQGKDAAQLVFTSLQNEQRRAAARAPASPATCRHASYQRLQRCCTHKWLCTQITSAGTAQPSPRPPCPPTAAPAPSPEPRRCACGTAPTRCPLERGKGRGRGGG